MMDVVHFLTSDSIDAMTPDFEIVRLAIGI